MQERHGLVKYNLYYEIGAQTCPNEEDLPTRRVPLSDWDYDVRPPHTRCCCMCARLST